MYIISWTAKFYYKPEGCTKSLETPREYHGLVPSSVRIKYTIFLFVFWRAAISDWFSPLCSCQQQKFYKTSHVEQACGKYIFYVHSSAIQQGFPWQMLPYLHPLGMCPRCAKEASRYVLNPLSFDSGLHNLSLPRRHQAQPTKTLNATIVQHPRNLGVRKLDLSGVASTSYTVAGLRLRCRQWTNRRYLYILQGTNVPRLKQFFNYQRWKLIPIPIIPSAP